MYLAPIISIKVVDSFDAALAHTTPDYWAPDKIHPADPGHAIIALAFLRAVGFEL